MTKRYIKDISKLTGVSVRTLRYYDKINLLKPSLRQENSYRLYTESDLRRLQQIISLKSLGFSLSKIRELLDNENQLLHEFTIQAERLREEGQESLRISHLLSAIIDMAKESQWIPWQQVNQLLEENLMQEKTGELLIPKPSEQSMENEALMPEVMLWLNKARDAYYRGRIHSLLNQIQIESTEVVIQAWQGLLKEMYGDNPAPKQALIEAIQQDPSVGQCAKDWLREVE